MEKGEILKELGKTKTTVGVKSLLNNFVEAKINGLDGKEIRIKYEEETLFTSAMGMVDDLFTITNITVEGITGFLEVTSNLQTYTIYQDFLLEVSNAQDLPWEMRVAAYQVSKELEEGYWTPMKKVLNTIRDECMDKAFKVAGINKVLGLNGWASTINFTAFCINQFVDIGELVVRSAQTEGYAILAEHYKNKLEDCKKEFLEERTEENAWKFYEAYVMLWKLRVAGEEKYLEMNRLEASNVITNVSDTLQINTINDVITETCHYKDKEASVQRMLETLDDFKFAYCIQKNEMPEEYKYLQKIVIECPVDVEFMTSEGVSACFMKDKEEVDISNSYGRFISVYRATTGDYVKIAYLKDDSSYVVKAVGLDNGKVSCSYAVTTDHQTCFLKGFDNITVSENNLIVLKTNEDGYTVDLDADGQIDIEAQQVDKNRISVQFDCQNQEKILVCYADQNGFITMPEIPKREGYVFEGWFTEQEGQGAEFTGKEVVDNSCTVYAKWMSTVKKGDINGDGAVNAKDKKLLYNHIAGIALLDDYDLTVADMNEDGAVNAKDKKMLYNHIAGISLLWE